MWGPSIIGFGSYHYKYDNGHEGDSPLVGFSPRAAALTLYLSGSFEQREELLEKFGKHKTDKGNTSAAIRSFECWFWEEYEPGGKRFDFEQFKEHSRHLNKIAIF